MSKGLEYAVNIYAGVEKLENKPYINPSDQCGHSRSIPNWGGSSSPTVEHT